MQSQKLSERLKKLAPNFNLAVIVILLFFVATIIGNDDKINSSTIPCISYSPSEFDGTDEWEITIQEAVERTEQISKISSCIRLYSTEHGNEYIIEKAQKKGMEIILGIWINENITDNEREIAKAKTLLSKYENISKVVVGNETLFWKRISESGLIKYIKEVRQFSNVPVGSAEPYHVWRNANRLSREVDFIGAHFFPYWEGLDVKISTDWVSSRYNEMVAKYSAPVYIYETGWPSRGTERRDAIASVENQKFFLNEMNKKFGIEGTFYNVIEMYDQPYKIYETEGRTGAHWGLYTASGQRKETSKFSANFIYGTLLFFILAYFIFWRRHKNLNTKSQIIAQWFLLIFTYTLFIPLNVIYHEYLLYTPITLFLLIPSHLIVLAIALILFFDLIKFIGEDKSYTGQNQDVTLVPSYPLVSVHIPCRNENPNNVIACAQSVLNNNYKNIEVIIIDNNTDDDSKWKPLEEFSKDSENVHFYHVSKLSGYKAGALNFALRKTHRDAKIIATLDSDYIVQKDWLEKTVPYMKDKVRVVQSPQAYRKLTGSYFENAVQHEIDTFFSIIMPIRSAENAIIQHGTMCLIDKETLLKVGGWPEWCITEDTELGIRILADGNESIYLPQILGTGIAPQNYEELSKQRFRWVYGAVRIFIFHFKKVLGFDAGLTTKQRVRFLAGWIPWFSHLLYPIFIISTFVGSYIILREERFVPPMVFAYSIIVMIFAQLLLLAIVSIKQKCTWKKSLRTALLGISQTPIIAKAVWFGIFYSRWPYEITGKSLLQKTRFGTFVKKHTVNTVVFIGLIVQIYFLAFTYSFENFEINIWTLFICILLMPYLAIIAMFIFEHYKLKESLPYNS